MKKLRWHFNLYELSVLVPKTRGEGFLACPYGHHSNSKLNDISSKIGCDIFGLDGALSIQCGIEIGAYEEKKVEFVNNVMPMLSNHYGFPHQKISSKEYYDWLLHKKLPVLNKSYH